MSNNNNEEKFAQIYKLMESGDFKQSVLELGKLEAENDPQAAYLLGYMYLNGKGVERSREIGLGYLEKSAKLGFVPAMKLLKGFEAKKPLSDEELKELNDKADAGDANSQYKLGMVYMKAQGVPQNKDKAVELFTKAALQDHFLSMIVLFDRYTLDDHFEKQWSRAYYWYHMAYEKDKERLNIVHPNIIKGEEDTLDAAENEKLTKDEKIAKCNDAIKNNYWGAYKVLGDLYEGEEALEQYRLGAQIGDCDCIKKLSELDPDNKDFYENEYERLTAKVGK